jgi:DNA-binding response OmpR family regulator
MDTKQKILLVDDEFAIIDNLAPFLERSGFIVITAQNGIEALQRINKDKPDLLVMDVLMPKMDGREALRQLRKSNNWIPILLLTQVGESSERAMALEEGADDYLNKPFDPHELVARIHAILRRAKPGQPPISMAWKLVSGVLVLDRRARRIYLNETEVILTPKALLLLEYLMTHPDELVTRDRLLDVVWGWDYPVGTRAVDTRIAELRRALKDEPANPRFIDTVPGQGYRFIGELEVSQ